jgi:hypothetical protein
MFSKGVILIFLTLGLSSSIAHSVPHQNRAQDINPCSVRPSLFPLDQGRFHISHHIQEAPAGGHHVLASSSSRQNATNNGTGKSITNDGTNTSATNSGSNTSTTNNGTKTSTDKSTTNNGVKKSTSDNGMYIDVLFDLWHRAYGSDVSKLGNTTTNGGTGTQSKLTGDNGNKNASSQDNGKNQNSNNNPQTSLSEHFTCVPQMFQLTSFKPWIKV